MNTSERPRIHLALTLFDWALEAITVALLAWMIWAAWDQHDALPEAIPSHFDHQGTPDRMSDRSSVGWLLTFAVVSYVVMLAVNRAPHRFNLPVDITRQTATYQYRLATRMMRFINLSMVLTFSLVYLEMASGPEANLGPLLQPAILTITMVPLIIYFALAIAHNPQ